MLRAIFFDAVGTTIRAELPVAEVYARFAHRYGLQLTPEELRQRFQSAFSRQRELDRQQHWRTSEPREFRRWRCIVQEVFPELTDTEAIFRELWQHFARADAWACYPEVADILERLVARGYLLGLASNFDERLRRIYTGLPCLHRCSWLLISSEIGWLKPARQFFEALARTVHLPSQEILYVGDDYETDCLSALEAGFQAVWLNRELAANSPHPELPKDTATPLVHAVFPPSNLPELPAESVTGTRSSPVPMRKTQDVRPRRITSLEQLLTLLEASSPLSP